LFNGFSFFFFEFRFSFLINTFEKFHLLGNEWGEGGGEKSFASRPSERIPSQIGAG
jgi:hypothetical protein